MNRSNRILSMVISNHKNLLDLPNYESTKGTTKEQQASAIKIFNNLENKINIEIKEQKNEEELKKYEEVPVQVNTQNLVLSEQTDKIDFEDPYSSESEYIPDTESEKSEEKGDVIKKLNQNMKPSCSLIGPDFEQPHSSESEYILDTESEESEEEGEAIKKLNQNIRPSCSSGPSTSSVNINLQPENNIDRILVSYGKFVKTSPVKIEEFKNSRPWTKKSACPYCLEDVTHFPRHLKRNHNEEGAVKELFAMSLKDPKRKDILNAIRRQGNFATTSNTNYIRPIRRPKSIPCSEPAENLKTLKELYVPCKDCLGYFKRNYLRRHRRKCTLRPSLELSEREQHLSTAQLFSICSGEHNNFYATLRLKKEVFPIMRNDAISSQAMNDVLVCCYAEGLLKKHKRTQIKNVISNKMRELGRLLLCLKNMTGLQKLFDFLKPQFFDNFVAATKVISGYNPETYSFKTSSLPLHMGTSLKQVCDVATKMVMKRSPLFPCAKPEETLKEIKLLKKLIETSWNCEISSLALKNLNERKYQKTKLLPLTEDVMKFQKFLNEAAKEACAALKENRQIKLYYRRLSECVLSLTLLLNRKRVGEIQYIKLCRYNQTIPQNQQEEFFSSLSQTEKMLSKTFKRIVTEGKGSKPVAILFPTYIQKFIEVLLSVRNLCVQENNEYLFANPNTKNKCLSGYHTLKKLAQESDVQDTSLFTSTRLRKQIATILQVLNLTEDEMI